MYVAGCATRVVQGHGSRKRHLPAAMLEIVGEEPQHLLALALNVCCATVPAMRRMTTGENKGGKESAERSRSETSLARARLPVPCAHATCQCKRQCHPAHLNCYACGDRAAPWWSTGTEPFGRSLPVSPATCLVVAARVHRRRRQWGLAPGQSANRQHQQHCQQRCQCSGLR